MQFCTSRNSTSKGHFAFDFCLLHLHRHRTYHAAIYLEVLSAANRKREEKSQEVRIKEVTVYTTQVPVVPSSKALNGFVRPLPPSHSTTTSSATPAATSSSTSTSSRSFCWLDDVVQRHVYLVSRHVEFFLPRVQHSVGRRRKQLLWDSLALILFFSHQNYPESNPTPCPPTSNAPPIRCGMKVFLLIFGREKYSSISLLQK